MSLAGIFLLLFLLVHLGINLSLIIAETPKAFNVAAHFMHNNLVIKVFEVILFGAFILHIIYGLILQISNWLSRPKSYVRKNQQQTSFFSKYMIHTALIVLIFLVIHIGDFYFKNLFGSLEEITYDGTKYVADLGSLVIAKFQMPMFVAIYIASFVFLAFHLHHGFQSAFQTLGIDHKSYTPVIKTIGVIYTILIFAGFTAMPLVIYFTF